MKEKNILYKAGIGFVLILLLLQACNIPLFGSDDVVSTESQTIEEVTEIAAGAEEVTEAAPTEELPSPTAIVHTITPSDPGWVHRWFKDVNSSITADENRAPGGDDYYNNELERPFTANEMIYRPDVDIQKAEIAIDDDFFYFTIYLKDVNPDTGDLQATYGAEIDTDLDGRGDFLFLCKTPNQTEWAIEMASGYTDSNENVGGKQPTYPEAPTDGDGYDQVIFSLDVLNDPDGVWCRKAPGSEVKVDIAVKRTLIDSPNYFAWGVWADASLADPALFDYNDHFTYAEEGSPYPVNSNYPIKALFLVDNTCRESYGFDPSGEIPGMCFIPTPTPTATATQMPTATPVRPGVIRGTLYWDTNNNGVRDAGEVYTAACTTRNFHLKTGACGVIGILNTQTGTGFSFTVSPGTYCLSVTSTTYITTPLPIQITVTGGNTYVRDIGHYYYIGR
ncbi:MAG: hypothetical protein ABIG43_06605 [Chloroflexota bacterium]